MARLLIATFLSLIGSLCTVATASANVITDGLTFSVASDITDQSVGLHLHSDPVETSPLGFPNSLAEVGRYDVFSAPEPNDEEVRGLSEFDLSGLSNSETARLSFSVWSEGGLNDFQGDVFGGFDGTIVVEAYSGNNAADLSDYQALTFAVLGTLAVSSASVSVNDVFTFDATTVYNDAIDDGLDSLGFRLRAEPLNSEGAWTFDEFRLATGTTVSEPGTALLAIGALAAAACARRRVTF